MASSKDETEEEQILLEALRSGNVSAFLELYRMFGDDLLIYAFAQWENKDVAIKAVEDTFERLWINKRFTEAQLPLYHFLKEELNKTCPIYM